MCPLTVLNHLLNDQFGGQDIQPYIRFLLHVHYSVVSANKEGAFIYL